MSEYARELAEAFGHPLASDLLEAAQVRNPHLQMHFHAGGPRVELVVKTDRGDLHYRREGHERWYDVFKRAELL